jgi:pseudouridine-5'-phosphate glycosidase
MRLMPYTTTIQIIKCQKPEFTKTGKPLKRRLYAFDIEKGVIVNSPVWNKGEPDEYTFSRSINDRRLNRMQEDGETGKEIEPAMLKKYFKNCPELGKKAEQHTYRIITLKL